MNPCHQIESLRSLRLPGMAGALAQQLEQPGIYHELSFEERLALLIDQETIDRSNRRLSKLLKSAHFKLAASLKDMTFQKQRELDKRQIATLSTLEWVARHQNVLITGACGTGKTYLACALGREACIKGYSAKYYRLNRLLHELTLGRVDGSYRRLLKSLGNTDVLVIDDWGLESITQSQRNDLLEVMDDRYGEKSTLIASQLPVSEWHQTLGDATLADAILDRMIHNAYRIQIKGPSMRNTNAQDLTHDEHLE